MNLLSLLGVTCFGAFMSFFVRLHRRSQSSNPTLISFARGLRCVKATFAVVITHSLRLVQQRNPTIPLRLDSIFSECKKGDIESIPLLLPNEKEDLQECDNVPPPLSPLTSNHLETVTISPSTTVSHRPSSPIIASYSENHNNDDISLIDSPPISFPHDIDTSSSLPQQTSSPPHAPEYRESPPMTPSPSSPSPFSTSTSPSSQYTSGQSVAEKLQLIQEHLRRFREKHPVPAKPVQDSQSPNPHPPVLPRFSET